MGIPRRWPHQWSDRTQRSRFAACLAFQIPTMRLAPRTALAATASRVRFSSMSRRRWFVPMGEDHAGQWHRSSCHYPRSALPTFDHYSSGMWRTRLLRPIRLEDGRTIRTLADAHDVILQLPEKELRRPQWQALVGLLLSAVATRQHHLLSILTVRLETELPRLAHKTESVLPPKKPSAPSATHRLKHRRKAKLLK
jgi:hypothetical protein